MKIVLLNSLSLLSFIVDILAALIGAGAAILVFYLTTRNDKKKEKAKTEETYKYRVSYLSSLIKASIEFIEKTSSNLDKLLKDIKDDDITFHLVDINPDSSFERIQELIKNEGYFAAYVETYGYEKVDRYHKLAYTVDFFNMQIEQIYSMHKIAQEFDFQRKKEFKSLTDEIINLTTFFGIESNISETDKEIINNSLKELYLHHPNNDNEKEAIEYYYNFIRFLLNDIFMKYVDIPEFNPLFEKIKKASQIYNEIKVQNQRHRESMMQISESLSDALIMYKETTTELDS